MNSNDALEIQEANDQKPSDKTQCCLCRAYVKSEELSGAYKVDVCNRCVKTGNHYGWD